MKLFSRFKKLFVPKGEEKPRKKIVKKTKKKVTGKILKKKVKKKVKAKPKKKVLKKKKSPPPLKKTTKEKEIGVVTHYFGKISVGIIKLKSTLKVGEKIHIKGAHDDFSQTVKSIQINHKDVSIAGKGSEIGIKVPQPVHENDRVYKL